VIAAFGKEFAKTGDLDVNFHCHLIDAQDTRNIGDYGTGTSVSEAQVQELLGWAKEFLGAAESWLSSN
jgi:uncharacterized protein (UPF0332 family)